MSGESEVGASISALAKLGYESTQLTFNDDSPWLSLIWLTVVERAPDSVVPSPKPCAASTPGP